MIQRTCFCCIKTLIKLSKIVGPAWNQYTRFTNKNGYGGCVVDYFAIGIYSSNNDSAKCVCMLTGRASIDFSSAGSGNVKSRF